jgi:hypothetical protein
MIYAASFLAAIRREFRYRGFKFAYMRYSAECAVAIHNSYDEPVKILLEYFMKPIQTKQALKVIPRSQIPMSYYNVAFLIVRLDSAITA